MLASRFIEKIIFVTLRPFIRLLLRYGVGYGEFAHICKKLYIDVAYTDFPLDKRKQTISRVSVLTGISRREIKHVKEEIAGDSKEHFSYNHAARILASWLNDPDFHDEKGDAAPLRVGDEGEQTFNALVRKYGNNTPYRAILDELVRVGAVSLDDDGVARMISMGYVPSKDSQELLGVALQSVADHIDTIDYNDRHKSEESRLQLTVTYDNVTNDGVEVFRQVSREKCQETLLFLNRFLATQDRDSNPTIDGSGQNRTGLGIFFFEEKPDSGSDSGSND